MLNTLLILLTLFGMTEKEENTLKADVTKSTIVWNATKVVGGGHTGTVEVKEASLDMDGDAIKGGSFIIDMTTISSTDLEGGMKDKLDGHLKSADFFGVENYQTSTFKITKVKKTGSGSYDVTGDITIKGKTESVNFPATVESNGDGVTVTATITLDRTKFNVRYGSNSFFDNLGDKAISDDFTLDVTLMATK